VIVTEEELRGAWRNGRGALPEFAPGTRFTPAAKDFLASLGIRDRSADSAAGLSAKPKAGPGAQSAPGQFPGASGAEPGAPSFSPKDGRIDLRPEEGKRLILTAVDMDGFIAARPQSIVIHPGVTVTDAARDRLRGAGIRLVPFAEGRCEPAIQAAKADRVIQAATATPSPASPASVPAGAPKPQAEDKRELFLAAKTMIMARLGDRADEALVEAVLGRVIAAL
jgi:hypothetical protein